MLKFLSYFSLPSPRTIVGWQFCWLGQPVEVFLWNICRKEQKNASLDASYPSFCCLFIPPFHPPLPSPLTWPLHTHPRADRSWHGRIFWDILGRGGKFLSLMFYTLPVIDCDWLEGWGDWGNTIARRWCCNNVSTNPNIYLLKIYFALTKIYLILKDNNKMTNISICPSNLIVYYSFNFRFMHRINPLPNRYNCTYVLLQRYSGAWKGYLEYH